MGGRPDRRDPRLSGRPARLGDFGSAGNATAAPWLRRFMRRSPTNCSCRSPAPARRSTACRSRRARAISWRMRSSPDRSAGSTSLGGDRAGIQTMPRVPSLALRLARVATGALDAHFRRADSHDWDLAAADLLVHEAGGAMTDVDGGSLIYNRPNPVHGALVAAGRARHAMLARPHPRSACRIRVTPSTSGSRDGRHGLTRPTADSCCIWCSAASSPISTSRIQGSRQAGYCRRLSQLRHRVCSLEGEGPANRRQCSYALFHCASAPAARS